MKLEKFLFCLIFFWVAIIWMNSLFPADISSAQSGLITSIFQNIFYLFGYEPDPVILSNIIRMIAHGVEFMILGILIHLYYKKVKFNKTYLLLIGVLVAIIDEIIQIFVPGRAFEIQDIFIDTLGYLIGLALILYIFRRNEIKRNINLEDPDES